MMTAEAPPLRLTLAALEALRAAVLDDDAEQQTWPAMPLAERQQKIAAHQQRRRDLDHRLTTARQATATLAATADAEAFDQLTAWRATLCDELLALPPRLRDPRQLALHRSLDLSVRVIDEGLDALTGTGLTLMTVRLGELMAGVPWHGSLPEIEAMLARREAAQSALDDALLPDAVRAQREAEAVERRVAYNAMDVRIGDGGLVAHREDGSVLDPAEMTPLQRAAFDTADAAFRAEQAARRAKSGVA